jgi:hypothetical protein
MIGKEINKLKFTSQQLSNKPDANKNTSFVKKGFQFSLVFILSILISPFYTESDQVFYNSFFESAKNSNLFELFLLQNNQLSSIEPGYTFIVWVFSKCFDRSIFIAFFNASLSLIYFDLWTKKGGNWLLVLLIICSNYYFYVIYFSAERLKFGFLFLGIALIFINQKKKFWSFVIFAIITHLQLVILSLSFFLKRAGDFKVKLNGRVLVYFFVIISILSKIFFDYVGWKISFYFLRYFDLEGVIKLLILIFFSALYSPSKKKVILSFLPILMAVIFLSGERVNIMAYFLFMYYCIGYRRGLNFGIFVVNLYFLGKTIFFVGNTIKFGSAF